MTPVDDPRAPSGTDGTAAPETAAPGTTATGACHCGACRLTLPAVPTTGTDCNCALCRRLGALWSYHDARALTVTGQTSAYARDIGASLDFHRCANCGCTTHWTARPGTHAAGKVGVNARLFDGFDPWTAQIRRIDGANDAWT